MTKAMDVCECERTALATSNIKLQTSNFKHQTSNIKLQTVLLFDYSKCLKAMNYITLIIYIVTLSELFMPTFV